MELNSAEVLYIGNFLGASQHNFYDTDLSSFSDPTSSSTQMPLIRNHLIDDKLYTEECISRDHFAMDHLIEGHVHSVHSFNFVLSVVLFITVYSAVFIIITEWIHEVFYHPQSTKSSLNGRASASSLTTKKSRKLPCDQSVSSAQPCGTKSAISLKNKVFNDVFRKAQPVFPRELTVYAANLPVSIGVEEIENCESDEREIPMPREIVSRILHYWDKNFPIRAQNMLESTFIESYKVTKFSNMENAYLLPESYNLQESFRNGILFVGNSIHGITCMNQIVNQKLNEMRDLSRYKTKFYKIKCLHENKDPSKRGKHYRKYPDYDNFMRYVRNKEEIPRDIELQALSLPNIEKCARDSVIHVDDAQAVRDFYSALTIRIQFKQNDWQNTKSNRFLSMQSTEVLIQTLFRSAPKAARQLKYVEYCCQHFIAIYDHWSEWTIKQRRWLKLRSELSEDQLDEKLRDALLV